MKKNILIFILCLWCCIFSDAQQRCGTVRDLSILQQNNPALYLHTVNFESAVQNVLSNAAQYDIPTTTVIIPVVVHIVYKNAEENISDELVYSQIQVLNEDFRRQNPDRVNTPAPFALVAADANIEFRLAKIDPDGNPTTAITRTYTTRTSFTNGGIERDFVKFDITGGADAWDTEKYLNIWVCGNLIDGHGATLHGYAQFPYEYAESPNTDGVVLNYIAFGREFCMELPEESSEECGYRGGRAGTHEVGHWLNLLHIWGDDYLKGIDGRIDYCSGSDEVDDTPNQEDFRTGSYAFPQYDNCTDTYPGIMFMNYMDYTYHAFRNLFTAGQVARMRAVFSTDTLTGVRRKILEDAEYLTTGCHTAYIDAATYLSTDVVTTCNVDILRSSIESGASLSITASNRIRLLPGFHAKAGSNFHAYIEPCASSSAAPAFAPSNRNNTEEQETEQPPSNINAALSENKISIYPNPVNDELRIINYELKGNETIQILDITGRIIFNSPFTTHNSIDVSGLSSGIYFLKIGNYTGKFVKK